jgi:hypothetical protein
MYRGFAEIRKIKKLKQDRRDRLRRQDKGYIILGTNNICVTSLTWLLILPAQPILPILFNIKHGLTQQQAAKKMGFETIYSYQRLEGKRCNPSLRTITRIKRAFPDFSIDYAVGC